MPNVIRHDEATLKFEQIDTVLTPWALQKRLQVLPEMRDEEARYFLVVDDQAETYQVWVDSTNPIRVGCSLFQAAQGHLPRRTRDLFSKSWECSLETLSQTLDAAHSQIYTWIKERGHTRNS